MANQAVEDAANLADVTYWDPLGEAWLPDMALIQSDNVHPTDQGQKALAKVIGEHLTDSRFIRKN